jgi:chromosome segregation ATPase
MFSFIKSFVGVKGEQLGQEIVKAIVEIDPESATQAQLEEMEKDLDKAGAVIQKLRADYDREVREAETASKRYNEMLAAAELLQRKLDNPALTEKSGIEASLAKLVNQLEQFAPEVEQEQKDVVEVKALLDEAQSAYRAKAESLAAAKGNLDRAKRDMQRAVMEQERADEKAKRAAEVAGLRQGSGSKLNIAVDAMQRRADEARAKTEAAKLKAETLTTISAPNADDPHIAEAMRQVQGTGQTGSLADRLAKLKR